jgi:6,7-dimethyl-8-ribityllumazine synthase
VKRFAVADTAPRFAVVVSRFNHLVSVRLLEGCTAELARRGVADDDVHVAWVPGAFEIPQAARALADTRRYDAIIALGVVIRGGTPHFDYVCRGVTDGVREVMRDTGVPVAFGVLTTDTMEQAMARAGGDVGNKGREALVTVLETLHQIRRAAGE